MPDPQISPDAYSPDKRSADPDALSDIAGFKCTQFREIDICCNFQPAHRWCEHACDRLQLILIAGESAETELIWRESDQSEQRRWLIGRHIVFIGAGILRSVYWEKAGAIIALSVDNNFIKRLALREAWSGVHVKSCAEFSPGDMFIRHLSGILESLCNPKEPDEHPVYVEALVTILATHLLRMRRKTQLRAAVEPGLTASQLNKVYSYIDEHLQETLHVQSLARVAGISKDHFAKLFKCTAGMTPHRYILSRRLEFAEKLIEKGELRIAEIAHESGFCDQSHLSRCFRKFRETFDVRTCI